MTSNKMPSEFLDSYNEDRSTGEAVMDRAVNKVFVSNKISTDEALTQFLLNLEKGISPRWKGLLAVNELEPIVKEVDFESPALRELMAKIQEKFLGLRIKKEEDTRKAHLMDAREFPEYYVSAAGSASDRTFIKLMDQFRARFIVHQLMDGVAFKDLRTTITLKDFALFFEGLGYWAPQKIVASGDQNGVVTFSNDAHVIENLLGSGVLDSRVRFHVEMMLDEAKDYVQVLNSVVGDFTHNYNSEIARHTEIFPSVLTTHETEQHAAVAYENLTPERKASVDRAIQNLAALRLKLDLALAEAQTSADLTALKHDYVLKEGQLLEYLQTYKIMTGNDLLERMRAYAEQLQVRLPEEKQEEVRKEEQKKEIENSVVDGSKTIFNSVEPGSFEMGEVGAQKTTTITKPFDMAATQTTQIVWRQVVEAAKARFPGEFDTLLNANPSHFPGDLNPVEQVSYEDIQVWLTAANKLIDAGDPVVQEIMPGTAKGSHLRLPTEAEWEFVARARGAAKGLYHFGENEAELPEYAWFSTNSGSKTHPVAEKKPLVINGKEFYDLHGNVWETVNDWYDGTLQGGVDPQGPATGSNRVFRGGSWGNVAQFLRTGGRNYWRPSNRSGNVGFRLVRTAVP